MTTKTEGFIPQKKQPKKSVRERTYGTGRYLLRKQKGTEELVEVRELGLFYQVGKGLEKVTLLPAELEKFNAVWTKLPGKKPFGPLDTMKVPLDRVSEPYSTGLTKKEKAMWEGEFLDTLSDEMISTEDISEELKSSEIEPLVAATPISEDDPTR